VKRIFLAASLRKISFVLQRNNNPAYILSLFNSSSDSLLYQFSHVLSVLSFFHAYVLMLELVSLNWVELLYQPVIPTSYNTPNLSGDFMHGMVMNVFMD